MTDAQRLRDLVVELLELSRLDAATEPADVEPLRLGDAVAATGDGSDVVIDVMDSGPGIAVVLASDWPSPGNAPGRKEARSRRPNQPGRGVRFTLRLPAPSRAVRLAADTVTELTHRQQFDRPNPGKDLSRDPYPARSVREMNQEGTLHRRSRKAAAFGYGVGSSAFGWLVAGVILGIALLTWLALKLVQPIL